MSPRFHVVIPERVRRERHIAPGDRLAEIVKHGVVHMVPIRPFSESKGSMRGTKARLDDIRDHSERF